MYRFWTIAAALLMASGTLHAQQRSTSDTATRRDTTAIRLTPITVTATRTTTDVFDVPTPVSVLDATDIRRRTPNTVADLFRGLPGLDVSGVGPNQVRPMIRGQRGQRVLVLSDGIRLNNTRRQQDFGEIPALVDISLVERVEIVRGPASVLYGSDAIGGVVNIITERTAREGLHGTLGYRYSTHDTQQRVVGGVAGRFGALTARVNGSLRDANAYAAPNGTFGAITLSGAPRVEDTGLRDGSVEGALRYRLAPGQDAFVRYERYAADSAGFGLVDPAAYAPDDPTIRIRYPRQRFDKVTAGYTGTAIGLPFADRVEVVGYWQSNRRRLTLDINIPTGGPPGPDSVVIAQRNATDIQTVGGRVELKKFLGGRFALTYGADLFRDATDNVDTSTSATFFAAPPFPGGPTVFDDPPSAPPPLVPNATFRSLGTFVQGEISLARRSSLVLGARYQDVRAATRTTPGITAAPIVATDRTLVGTANAIVGVGERVSLIGTVGRAFRSPNLVERFFNGPTPEGMGFQVPNPTLEAETSLNVDLGTRYRDRYFFLEGFVFQNRIFDAIRIEATGDTVSGLPAFTNVNVGELRARGVELNGDVRLPRGFALGAALTYLDTKDVTQDQNSPIGDGFSSALTGFVRYQHPSGRFWGEYRVRHNGERDASDILPGNPIGETLPAFTTQSVRAGLTVFRRGAHSHRVSVGVLNLTNALYAEFSNAGFFRPEPGRRVVVTYDFGF